MKIMIYRYAIYRDCIELHVPGSVITITNSKDIDQIKEWISESKRFAKTTDEITSYINYKIDEEW